MVLPQTETLFYLLFICLYKNKLLYFSKYHSSRKILTKVLSSYKKNHMLLNLQKVAVIILYNIKQNLRINMRFQPVLHHPLILGVTTHTHTHMYTRTVHMALMGYFIVFSFVTKPGQTLEFLLWGTIVPLNFLAGYYCSIVASTPQPTVYAFTHTHSGMSVISTLITNFITNVHEGNYRFHKILLVKPL